MNVWTLAYEGFDPDQEPLREALCTVGNGRFATRGAVPWASAGGPHYPGTYAAGVYNRLESEVAGRVVENEDLVNLPNWLPLSFRTAGGEWFDLGSVELLEYRQELDIRTGVLRRTVRFAEEGRHTRMDERRLVSMAEPHLAAIEITLLAEDWSGLVEIRSFLDGKVVNAGVARYRDLANRHLHPVDQDEDDPDVVWLTVETVQSGLRIAQAARTRVFRGGSPVHVGRARDEEVGRIGHILSLDLREGEPVAVEKTVAMYTSRDPAVAGPDRAAREEVARCGTMDELLEGHAREWEGLWDVCRLRVDGGKRSSMVLNLHIFHLLQTASPNTVGMDVGIPARGLHGEAYRGHVFWDELFIFPFLNLRLPQLTRALLGYRYRRLPAAKRLAEETGFQGAMFPWQSGSDGGEETQRVHLNPRSGRWLPDNSRLQRHISSAVAFNTWQHYQSTGDLDWLMLFGAEMILEIARFWASIAERDGEGRYHIRGVVGPDEYHEAYPWRDEPGLDDNAYTNVMAAWVLCRAMEILGLLPPPRRDELTARVGISPEELERWDEMSRTMTIPFHDGVISQFAGYERLEEFDWLGYRERYGDIQRLDRILEAEGDTPDRYKLSKQADVLMLFYLLSADELRELFERLGYEWDPGLIPRTIEYYEARTSHGSTLSRVVHAWVLARSERERSWSFFLEALESDISDVQGGTTAEGIHLGAMAGTVDLVQRGYTGLVTREDVLWFDPALPPELGALDLSMRYRQHWDIDVHIGPDQFRVTLPDNAAAPISVGVRDDVREVAQGETQRFDLDPGR